jgi:hypothetical protein
MLILLAGAGRAAAQADTLSADGQPRDSTVRSDASRPQPSFQFSREAGLGLRAMWEESVAA